LVPPAAVPKAVSPAMVTFLNGTWTGSVAVLEPADNMYLRANDGSGHIGDSNLFNVLPVPGEIRGSKWNDLDKDGQWDAGEPGLSDDLFGCR
jgi:hypothetical protein